MGVFWSRRYDKKEPARAPLYNRGPGLHSSTTVPVIGQPPRTRSSTTTPLEATSWRSPMSTVPPKRSPLPNAVSHGAENWLPQPNPLRSIAEEQPARTFLINKRTGRRVSVSAHVFAQFVVKSRSENLPVPTAQVFRQRFTSSSNRTSMILSSEVPRRLQLPKVIVKNRELVLALLQQLEVPHIYNFPDNKPWFLELVSLDSIHYVFVTAMFWNDKFNWNYSIVDIKRVWNPYLMAQYMLMKEKRENELVERYLFHGTSHEALIGVVNDNFNWRKVVTGKYGWGVSFADNPWYASHYSKKKLQNKNHPYVMVLAKVLVEYGAISQGNSFAKVPTKGYSTRNLTKEVIVKYDDASFYPEFIVCFKKKVRGLRS